MGNADFATCRADSLQFAYPTNWVAEVDEGDDGVSVALQSQGASFAIIGVYSVEEEPYDLIEQTLAALRDEHPGIESEETSEDLSGRVVEAEANFLSIDTLVQCWLRSWREDSNSIIVLMQSIEREAAVSHAVFQAICQSVVTCE